MIMQTHGHEAIAYNALARHGSVKISQHLTKLWARVEWHLSFTTSVQLLGYCALL